MTAGGDGIPEQSDEGALEDRSQELIGVAQQVAGLVIKRVTGGVQLVQLSIYHLEIGRIQAINNLQRKQFRETFH